MGTRKLLALLRTTTQVTAAKRQNATLQMEAFLKENREMEVEFISVNKDYKPKARRGRWQAEVVC